VAAIGAIAAAVGLSAIGAFQALGERGEVPTHTDAPRPTWTDVSLPQQVDDVRVRITSVAIGRVPLEGLLDEERSAAAHLMVRLEIDNLSLTRKIDFRGFDPTIPRLGYVQLTDNHHNVYRCVGFGAAKPQGQLKLASIYPGESVQDVLMFEVPVKAAAFLRLELPGEHVGRPGCLRFQIDRAHIRE
jgi:hypothetical protein